MFRSLVKWFAILIVVHLITFFVFDTVLSGLILPMVEDGMRMSGHTLLLLFELALHLIIALTFVKSETSFTDYQKALKDANMRAEFYDTMIDVAEEMFKIPIRKKAGPKQ